jgi:putative endonuclease
MDGGPSKGKNMFYTYVLQSVTHPHQFYRGHTSDLKQRLAEHNAEKCLHTSKCTPWKIKFYAAFDTLELAQEFEQYLKTGSGHAFSKRHLGLNSTAPSGSRPGHRPSSVI